MTAVIAPVVEIKQVKEKTLDSRDAKYVRYEQNNEIVKVTIDRPRFHNAISRRVYAELDAAFARAEADDGVKVIVVAGAGENFGAGHDIGSPEMLEELPDYPRDVSLLGRIKDIDRGIYWRMHDRWRNIGKPTIAMVQGFCYMGSWMLVSCCDLVVASDDAKFVDRSVRWGGVHHEYPAHFLELGPRKAKEHLWTGDFIDAHTAERIGMINRVVPRSELEAATDWLAQRIAINDLISLKLSKMSVNQAADIQGQSMAVKAASGYWLTKYPLDEKADPANNVNWAKQQNQRFDDQERTQKRPWT